MHIKIYRRIHICKNGYKGMSLINSSIVSTRLMKYFKLFTLNVFAFSSISVKEYQINQVCCCPGNM